MNTPFRTKRLFQTALIFLCTFSFLHGASNWIGPSGNNLFTNTCNWSCGCVPGAGTEVLFNSSATGVCGATITIDLCGGTSGCPHQVDELDVDPGCNYTFRFTNGWLQSSPSPAACDKNIINGRMVFTCGGNLTTTSASGRCFFIACGANSSGLIQINGACSTMFVKDISIANSNNTNGTLIVENGSTATINNLIIAPGSGTGTAIIDNATVSMTSGQVCMGCGSNSVAYFRVDNGATFTLGAALCGNFSMSSGNGSTSTFIVDGGSTVSLARDIDFGKSGCDSDSYVTFTGDSDVTVGEDIILGRGCGEATLNISGTCTSVSVGGGMQVGQASGGGYLDVSCGANLTIENSLGGSGNNTCYGSGCLCDNAIIKATNNGVITINQGIYCQVQTAQNTEIILDGGTHTGSADLRLNNGAVIRGDGCFGAGLITNDIELNGGSFNDGTLTGETVILSGSITQNAAPDDLVINGLGTIRIGADDNIASGIDVDLNGGTLDFNGHHMASAGNPLGTITLDANSSIALQSGDNSQDIYFTDFVINSGTVNISGWDGSAGLSGTGGRLLVDNLSNGWVLGDNGGAGFDGINWGALGTKTTILDAGGGFFELVPLGVAIPEPSAWLVSVSLLFLATHHFSMRRRKSRNVSTCFGQ